MLHTITALNYGADLMQHCIRESCTCVHEWKHMHVQVKPHECTSRTAHMYE